LAKAKKVKNTIKYTLSFARCQGQKEVFAFMGKQLKLIFVAYITKNGRRLYARDYGYKAWPIWVEA
jgi:hypothetical protein